MVYDAKAFDKRIQNDPDGVALLKGAVPALSELEDWKAENIEKCLKDYVASKDAKIKNIIHALRIATTGKPVGFGMFETLQILGKSSTLARIDRALAKIQ